MDGVTAGGVAIADPVPAAPERSEARVLQLLDTIRKAGEARERAREEREADELVATLRETVAKTLAAYEAAERDLQAATARYDARMADAHRLAEAARADLKLAFPLDGAATIRDDSTGWAAQRRASDVVRVRDDVAALRHLGTLGEPTLRLAIKGVSWNGEALLHLQRAGLGKTGDGLVVLTPETVHSFAVLAPKGVQ